METGRIMKALSGFYYVDVGEEELISCRGRGKLRHQHCTPLVGDLVEITRNADGSGAVEQVLPRKNHFPRPAVANIDQLVLIVSDAIPITEPILIDRLTSLAARQDCQCVICINKCDLVQSDRLYSIYSAAGFPTLYVSAETGEGLPDLVQLLVDKASAFTGNSGVGKSSILNKLDPNFSLPVSEVSQRLGRGKHTTRHVELYRLPFGGVVADTPGFAAFDSEQVCPPGELAATFQEFRPYLDQCRFVGCSHTKEKGCAILQAVKEEKIPSSRHASYLRLYQETSSVKEWERKKQS